MGKEAELRNDILYLYLEGRMDAGNASEIEKELESQRQSLPHTSVVVDMEALDYIASAGLRVILRLRKAEPTLTIENVSSEVYDILEMTGFTEMIPVSRAYRHFSVDGCKIIGEGSNGVVYRLDADTIIKVYRNPDCLEDVQRERELSRRAFVLGISTAIAYDVVKVGDKYGSVFELLDAKSFTQLIREEPENVDTYLRQYVDLMKKIHATEDKTGQFPDSRITVRDWAAFLQPHLPEGAWKKLTAMVAELPEDFHLVHGDYHLNNVMMQNGEAILIDMDTLSTGHPIVEIASVFNAYVGFAEAAPDVSKSFLGMTPEKSRAIWDKTLRMYMDTDDKARLTELENKAKVLGYTRLLRRSIRRTKELGDRQAEIVAFYKKALLEALEQVDTLLF